MEIMKRYLFSISNIHSIDYLPTDQLYFYQYVIHSKSLGLVSTSKPKEPEQLESSKSKSHLNQEESQSPIKINTRTNIGPLDPDMLPLPKHNHEISFNCTSSTESEQNSITRELSSPTMSDVDLLSTNLKNSRFAERLGGHTSSFTERRQKSMLINQLSFIQRKSRETSHNSLTPKHFSAKDKSKSDRVVNKSYIAGSKKVQVKEGKENSKQQGGKPKRTIKDILQSKLQKFGNDEIQNDNTRNSNH